MTLVPQFNNLTNMKDTKKGVSARYDNKNSNFLDFFQLLRHINKRNKQEETNSRGEYEKNKSINEKNNF